MIYIKTVEEIKRMRQSGRILAEVMFEVLDHAKPDISELELDALAEKLIRKKGAEPGFQKVSGYKHTICVSTNNVVVHGIPTKYRFKEGDVIGIDCGVFYKGFYTDMAETVQIQNSKIKNFLETGRRALEKAIKQAKVGNRVGHISKTIQDIVEGEGYSVVRSLVGHGVGRELHEEPEIPGFLEGEIKDTPRLQNGMVIAIEVIYNQGRREVILGEDGWTIRTKDGSVAGLFERTIAVTENGPIVLTELKAFDIL